MRARQPLIRNHEGIKEKVLMITPIKEQIEKNMVEYSAAFGSELKGLNGQRDGECDRQLTVVKTSMFRISRYSNKNLTAKKKLVNISIQASSVSVCVTNVGLWSQCSLHFIHACRFGLSTWLLVGLMKLVLCRFSISRSQRYWGSIRNVLSHGDGNSGLCQVLFLK